jgi:hypothetical protein
MPINCIYRKGTELGRDVIKEVVLLNDEQSEQTYFGD